MPGGQGITPPILAHPSGQRTLPSPPASWVSFSELVGGSTRSTGYSSGRWLALEQQLGDHLGVPRDIARLDVAEDYGGNAVIRVPLDEASETTPRNPASVPPHLMSCYSSNEPAIVTPTLSG
jgi:hypothetical protein